MGTKIVLLALLGGVLAFYLYNPYPEDLEQPALFCLVNGVFRIIEDLGKVSEMVGYKELVVYRRDALEFLGWITHGPTPADVKVTNTKFDGVPVRLYQPASLDTTSGNLSPALIYVHGGGYVMGSVNLVDAQMYQIVQHTGIIVVAVKYRLAPEHPTPAAFNDCDKASRYIFANAEQYGVDPQNIGVGGDSAGGNMAASLSLKYRDMGGSPQFSYQILIYPWLQALDFNLPSYVDNEPYNRPDMQRHGMVLYTLGFLGIPRSEADKVIQNRHISLATRNRFKDILKPSIAKPEVDKKLASQMEEKILDPYNFPMMAKTLKGLPPAIVLTMGLDSLRDEGLKYVELLREAGVHTEHYHDDICWHASFNFSDGPFAFECGIRLVMEVIRFINEAKEFAGAA